jgi:alpha-1,2-glucosyltransferase
VNDTRNAWLFATAVAIAWLAACAYAVIGADLRGDEYAHMPQLERFLRGDWSVMRDAMTTVPAYHASIALVMRALGLEGLGAARVVTGLWSLVAIVGFVRLRRAVLGHDDWIGNAQFAAFPLVAPFAFLIYTDIASLAAMLWATDACVRGRHGRAALILVVALAMRQNNVYWIALFAALATWPALREHGLASLRQTLPPLWPYLVPCAVFAGYWIWNGSISFSPVQSAMHPDTSLHVANLYFMLFCAAILLPLQVLDGVRRFVAQLPARPWLALLPLALVALYYAAFAVDHPYNLIENAASWRNRTLQLTQHSAAFKSMFGAVATFAAIGLAWQRLANASARWLFPLAAGFVCLSWLVEQRYYLIPLALLLAFRQPLSRRAELATLALWGILAVFLFHGMISGTWYL